MRKMLLFVVYIISFQMNAQEKITLNGDRLYISGWASELIIVGHDLPYVDIVPGEDNDSKKPAQYKPVAGGAEISLLPTTRTIQINVPRGVSVDLKMRDVVFETRFDRNDPTDWRHVSIVKLAGDIEFAGDGYHISLVDISGGASVVTYGDITASFVDLSNCDMISLDTYWGEVSASIPQDASIDLVMRAKSGKVVYPENLSFLGLKKKKRRLIAKLNGGRVPVLLHSEGGREVTLSAR